MQRLIKVDGKIRIDKCYPTGFMGECPLLICFGVSDVAGCVRTKAGTSS